MLASPVAEFPSADDWQVFHGDANPAAARIYVRMRLAESAAFDRLRGEIVGPFSRYARTLPATTRFEAMVHGPNVLAEAALIDPCFWTPELPYLYRVRLTLEAAGQVRWSDERTFGVRRLGVRGRQFSLEGKNWVLRGGLVDDTTDFDWDGWREQELVAFVREPDDAFCAEADQRGVLVAATVASPCHRLETLLLSWQRHPSVGIVLLPAELTVPGELLGLSPNTLFVAEMPFDPTPTPAWADAVLYQGPALETMSQAQVPRLIARRLPGRTSPKSIRSACDALQSDFASVAQFSGYLV